MAEPQDWVSVKEYAQRFGIHVQTVYSAIRRGLFKRPIDRPTGQRAIRIGVPRESIQTHKHVE